MPRFHPIRTKRWPADHGHYPPKILSFQKNITTNEKSKHHVTTNHSLQNIHPFTIYDYIMNEIEQAVQAFFHSFALRVLNEAGANPDSPQAVKQALLEIGRASCRERV